MSVELKDSPKVDSAKIAVVDGKGPCLLEKHVIGTLGLIKIIHQVSNNANVCLRQEFQKKFSGGLGWYKGLKFTIKVNSSVNHKFCKTMISLNNIQ